MQTDNATQVSITVWHKFSGRETGVLLTWTQLSKLHLRLKTQSIFSLLPITSSHSYASASDLTCYYWCYNICHWHRELRENSTVLGVQLQEHWQEASQCNTRAYMCSISRSLVSEQNKSAITDHAISVNHVIDWDQARVIDQWSNKMDHGQLKSRSTSGKSKTTRWTEMRVLSTLSHLRTSNCSLHNEISEWKLVRTFWRTQQLLCQQ